MKCARLVFCLEMRPLHVAGCHQEKLRRSWRCSFSFSTFVHCRPKIRLQSVEVGKDLMYLHLIQMLEIAFAGLIFEAKHAASIRDIGKAVRRLSASGFGSFEIAISTNARRLNIGRSSISNSAFKLLVIATAKLCCQSKQQVDHSRSYGRFGQAI